MAREIKVTLLNTVPYSPQCNILAENMFSQLKYNALYKFKARDAEDQSMAPVQRTVSIPRQRVIKEWDEYIRASYTYESTAKVFGAWITVLNECKEGRPLFGIHYEAGSDFAANTINASITYRRRVN